jgi:ribosomal protein S18 acetylase RimI-like enzyme
LVAIRRSTPEDADALESLYLELQDHHFPLQPHNPRYQLGAARWRQLAAQVLADPAHEVLIADDDGVVVGCSVLRYEEKPWGLACQMETLVVTAGRRGQGVGDALVAASEESGTRRGARAMRVEVIVENDGGRSFYERRGYQALALRYGKPLTQPG